MINRGEIVEKAVRESGFPITKLAKRLRKSRRHLYNVFENDKLDWDTIKDIGKIIHYDFSRDFPELKFNGNGSDNVANDPVVAPYGLPSIAEDVKALQEEVGFWKAKYIELLESYNKALIKRTDPVAPEAAKPAPKTAKKAIPKKAGTKAAPKKAVSKSTPGKAAKKKKK